MRHYCTLFDRHYIDRGLALHRSLARHCGDFRLHVLCLDAPTREALALLDLARTELVDIAALEAWDPELARARTDRTPVEYYFTCKPALLGYILREAGVSRVDYLDSDIAFFSDPAPLEEEITSSSVALSPHRFDAANADRERYGRFNAGWVSVGASDEGRRFVAWWRALCLEWCRMDVEPTRFGDQKYLDRVPGLFPTALAVSHRGVNLGPWNVGGARIEPTAQGVTVDGRPLVLFHFHGTRRMLFNLHESGLYDYGVALTPAIRDAIYRPYVSELAACARALEALPPALRSNLLPEQVDLSRRLVRTLRAVARHTAVAPAA